MRANRASVVGMGAGWILLIALCGEHVSAQENEIAGADSRAASEAPQVVGPPEHVIYLPFHRFSDVWKNPDASVVIPYADYLKLWSLKLQEQADDGQRVDAVITEATYTATVAEDVARIRAELTVNVLGKPWVTVPVRFGDAAVGGVTSEDGNVLLQGTGKGTYALLFENQGLQRVSLELTARVDATAEGRWIAFDCPPAAVATFELSVPRADQEIDVHPRVVQQSVAAGDEETRIRASMGATRRISATWRPRTTSQPEMQLLANVTNRQRYHVADGLIHTDAWLTYDVLRGELQQVRIVVPPQQEVLDVTATTKIQSWQTEKDDDRQILTIALLNPVDDQVTVELHTEQKFAEKSVSLGGYEEGGAASGVHALDVARESGQLVVTHSSDLNVRVTDQAGLVRIEPDEVSREIRSPAGLSYKYYHPGFTLDVAVAEIEPRVRVTQLTNLVIGEEELEPSYDLSYSIERAGLFELAIRVPDGLVIDDVQSEHLQEYRIADGILTVVLQERTLGDVSVAVSAHQELDETSTELTLPVLEPLDVARDTGFVKLFADESVELTSSEELLEAARPTAVNAGEMRGSAPLRAAWQFSHHPVTIPVSMSRKPTRLSATVATDIQVEPTRTRVTTLVDFRIEYAGLDTFRISVPEEALDTLQIEAVPMHSTSPALKQKTAGDIADGWVPYMLVMQRETLGRQRFRITYDVEPTALVIPVTVDADDAAADEDGRAGQSAASERPAEGEEDGAVREDGFPTDGDETDNNRGSGRDDADSASEAEGADSENVAESDSGDAPTDGGRVVERDREEIDPNRLQATIRIIRPLGIEAGDGRQATRLTQISGEVRIEKEPSLTIAADATGGDVEPIDVRELTLLPKSGTLAFRYRAHPPEETIAVTITQSRYEAQEVIATVVSRALVEVVLGEDLTATYRCRYRLKSTERQRLRVELPKGLQVLSVLVDDTDVRLEPDPAAEPTELWDSYFVKVARSGTSDEPFSLTFQFLWTVHPQPFDRGLQGTITLPLPRIGERATSAVQQTRVVVWVPQQFALIGDPTDFTLLGATSLWNALLGGSKRSYSAVDDDEWIGGVNSALLEFPTTGRVAYRYSNLGGELQRDPTIDLLWWNTLWYTLVVSGTIAVIGFLLLRTSWENKLGILLLLAFGGMLLGLKSEHVLAHALSAARWGLLFVVGLWIVEALFGRRRVEPAATTIHESARSRPHTQPAVVAVVPPPGVFEHFHSERSHDQDFR